MAFHSHGKKVFEAQRVFTDREEPMALFKHAFTEPQERDDHRVICWYGVGGQGKSALHDQIRSRIAKNPDVALAGLEFDDPDQRRIESAMLKLRGDLAGRRLTLPTFDLAFMRLFALERPGENIREVHPQIFRRGESEIVDDLIDWSENAIKLASEAASLAVPGINLLYRYGARLTGRLADWWASREAKENLAGLDQLSRAALAEKLPGFLGYDLWRAQGETGCPRIVLTIDTHEKLARNELRADAWLQTLVRETPGALVLIFGRDRLRWAELDDRWEGVLDQHLLGALSDADADRFLAAVPIPEDDIRTRIVGASEGLPHYLDLAVSQYEAMRNRGKTPSAEDFGATPAEVRERFLDHLPPDERCELFLAAYPESLSERLLLDLAEAFLGGAGQVNWARLGRRSFMTGGADGRLVMHALMREALQEQDRTERPEFFIRVHEFLFEHHAGRARVPDAISVTPEAERAFLAACFHSERLGRGKLLEWIQGVYEPFHDAARWQTLEVICNRALLKCPDADESRAWLLHELARIRKSMGHYAEAEALFEQALAIKKTAIGEAHHDYASTLNALGIVQQTMGRYAEAKALYEKALAIDKATLGEMDPNYTTVLHNLAWIHYDMGRYAEAKALYEKALAIKKATLGETDPNYAAVLHNLAQVYHDMGRYAEAKALYEKALAIKKATLGETHPGYAFTLKGLAHVSQNMSRNVEAKTLYEQTLAIEKTTLGETHPEYAATLHNLALLLQATGRDADAMAFYEQVLTIIEATCGATHPNYAITLQNLAHVHQNMGRYAQAEPLYEQALAIIELALGKEHPHSILFEASLAGCKAAGERIDEARLDFTSALERAEALTESRDLWVGRVRLKWARGLKAGNRIDEARQETRSALDLLTVALGSDAAFTQAARDLLGSIEEAG